MVPAGVEDKKVEIKREEMQAAAYMMDFDSSYGIGRGDVVHEMKDFGEYFTQTGHVRGYIEMSTKGAEAKWNKKRSEGRTEIRKVIQMQMSRRFLRDDRCK